ncbi:MAG: hypothetical protein RLZZ230_801 [Candidatus Parcubacteria bacterium]|jgi:hypothetical protein
MKTLKFEPKLCDLILTGEKKTTWRLFDEKDLTVGDDFELINYETKEIIGVGRIMQLMLKTLGTLDDDDWKDHERFPSLEEMYATYSKYSGQPVNPDTEVKIIHFDFISKV